MIICKICKKEKNKQGFHYVNKDFKTGQCKQCKSEIDKKYREKNKEKLSAYFKKRWEEPERRAKNKLGREIRRTGFDATEYVKDKVCETCGMTNDEHKQKWNERLHIHHVENTGRHFLRKGLKPDHTKIKILCRSCHVSEDNILRGKENGK